MASEVNILKLEIQEVKFKISESEEEILHWFEAFVFDLEIAAKDQIVKLTDSESATKNKMREEEFLEELKLEKVKYEI